MPVLLAARFGNYVICYLGISDVLFSDTASSAA